MEMINTTTQGTKEWSYKNLNICKGCLNNCSYCYAKRMAIRFKRIETQDQWKDIELDFKTINKGYRKLNNPKFGLYDYMFPTSHDIFPSILPYCIKVLKKVLKVGNTILITTKPNYECIRELCEELKEWKDQICFRFTITSHRNEILKKYEPNAPNDASRLFSLKYAYEKGFKTSISIEPFLDKNPIHLIKALEKWVNISIWLGIMSGFVPDELKPNYTIKNLRKIIKELEDLPYNIHKKIILKDSIVNKLNLDKNYIGEIYFL